MRSYPPMSVVQREADRLRARDAEAEYRAIPEEDKAEAALMTVEGLIVHQTTACPIWGHSWNHRLLKEWAVYDGTDPVNCPHCLKWLMGSP